MVRATQALCLHDRGVVMSTGQLMPERKKGLAVCSAVITPVFLLWCPPAGSTDRASQTGLTDNSAPNQLIETHGASLATRQQGLSVKVFTSPDDQCFRADHFLGLEVFKEAYPGVRIIATSAVVDRIDMVYQEKIDKWKKILGSGATSHAVAISTFDGNSIEFEGAKIEVLKNIQGDTDENTMLWIPGQRILIGGDVLFNDMHVYTAETDRKARGKWLNSLQKIRELKPSVVIPGHSKVGAPLDASSAVHFTENYLLVFDEELKKAKDPDSFINTMKERFPSAEFLLALERGAMANVKSDKKDSYMTPANKPYACRFRTSRGKSARLV